VLAGGREQVRHDLSFSSSLRDQAGQTRASSSRTDDGEHLSPVCSVTCPEDVGWTVITGP
jgi:hypothetical protein